MLLESNIDESGHWTSQRRKRFSDSLQRFEELDEVIFQTECLFNGKPKSNAAICAHTCRASYCDVLDVASRGPVECGGGIDNHFGISLSYDSFRLVHVRMRLLPWSLQLRTRCCPKMFSAMTLPRELTLLS
jgi:hypothetical protein